MRITVLGAGFVGTELGRQLRDTPHTVVGTTTTESKVDTLKEVFDEVKIAVGSDREQLADATRDSDAVIVTVGPNAQRAMSADERRATYETVLVQTAENVTAVAPNSHLIALSSFSVYGRGDGGVITEEARLTDSDDPSPACFRRMEEIYSRAGRATILRCSDIYGPSDPSVEEKIVMAHKYLGGSVPFSGDALFYRVSVMDVIRAVLHVLGGPIVGIFNFTEPGVPPTNRERFDAICLGADLPPLEYRDEIEAPVTEVSVEKILNTGFTF